MKILMPVSILVTTALFGIAAVHAAPGMSAAEAAAPGTGYVPGWYPPSPGRGRYTQPWQPPTQWPAPQQGYSQPRPYHPLYGQYPATPTPAAPAENPLSATLNQTREQLVAKSAELDTTLEQLARVQDKLRVATAALQKAQADTVNAGIQVDDTMVQVDSLRKILCELAARIETRKAALHDALNPPEMQPDDRGSAADAESSPETGEQGVLQHHAECAQLTPPPAVTSGQRALTIEAPPMATGDGPLAPESAQTK